MTHTALPHHTVVMHIKDFHFDRICALIVYTCIPVKNTLLWELRSKDEQSWELRVRVAC
jgi:hypothetical protein